MASMRRKNLVECHLTNTVPLTPLARHWQTDQVNLQWILPVPLTPRPEALARLRIDDFFPNDFHIYATFRCVEN